MDISENKKELTLNENSNRELGKIKELSKNIEKDTPVNKTEVSRESADNILEQRIKESKSNEGISDVNEQENQQDSERFNKKGEVSYGISGCEAFCQKTHDSTKIHGTY